MSHALKVSVVSFDKNRRRFYSRLVAGQQVNRLHLEAVTLRPAHIHSQKHLRPVLRLGAARARVQGQYRVVRVVGLAQHYLQPQIFQALFDCRDFRRNFRLLRKVFLLQREFQEDLRVVEFRHEIFVRLDSRLHVVEFLRYLLRGVGVVPEGRLAHLVFQLGDFFFLARDVKVNSPFRSACRAEQSAPLFCLPALNHLPKSLNNFLPAEIFLVPCSLSLIP